MDLVLTRGREGVQNPGNLADVICERPLRGGPGQEAGGIERAVLELLAGDQFNHLR